MNEEYKTYLFEYRHAGSEWILEVKATSPDDAKAKVRNMAWAVYAGELVLKIPAEAGLVARIVVWLRNLVLRSGQPD